MGFVRLILVGVFTGIYVRKLSLKFIAQTVAIGGEKE
jgi:hypothetical protein